MGGKVKKKGSVIWEYLYPVPPFLFLFFLLAHPSKHPPPPTFTTTSVITISTPLFISPMSPLANVIQPNHLFHFEPTLSCNLRRYQVYLSKISTIYDQNRLNITENIKLNEMANIDRI